MRWAEFNWSNPQRRTRSGFLWRPRTVGYETRWLEWAKWREHYHPATLRGWYGVFWID